MPKLTPEGEKVIAALAERYAMGVDSVKLMLDAVAKGGGRPALSLARTRFSVGVMARLRRLFDRAGSHREHRHKRARRAMRLQCP